MTSDSKPPGSDRIQPSNDDNPFVAFKKYADEQFASFFQNFIGLPSSTQLRNLEEEFFDEHPRLKSLSRGSSNGGGIQELHDKANQQSDKRVIAFRFPDSPFLSFTTEDFSFDSYGRWEKQAKRQIEMTDDSAKSLRCPYRPADSEPPERYQYRPGGAESTALSQRSSESSFNLGLPFWYEKFPTENHYMYSNDYMMHRSPFGVSFNLQNIPLSAWPLAYIALSPYSPLMIERELRQGDSGPDTRWRNAFEDLILLHRGLSMKDPRHYNNGDDQVRKRIWQCGSNTLPGIQWVRNMLNRSLFGKWRSIDTAVAYDALRNDKCRFQMSDDSGTNLVWEARRSDVNGREGEEQMDRSPRKEEEENHDEITELDLYEHFLGNRNRTSPLNQSLPAPTPPIPQSSLTDPAKTKAQPNSSTGSAPSIISTLTTTERQVLPDGTTHTKFVLKRRFADGREESNEAEHTTHAAPGAENSGPTNSKATSTLPEACSDNNDQNQKKGWFW